MITAAVLLGVVAVVLAVAHLCERLGLSTPLVLVVVGAALGAVPGVPEIRLEPELVLTGLLPPLLYAAAVQLSLVDLRRDITGVLLLSVGAVVVTTAAVGGAVALALPAVGLAAGFALGAVVAPPDAVAATAVARRIGMPRRLTRLLEGESLVNDATALALLAAASTALVSTVSAGDVVLDFAVLVVVGVAAGAVVGLLLSWVRARLDDAVMVTVVSLAAPFAAYLAAEEAHGSGVLAVVTTGLLLARSSARLSSATSRVVETTTWKTIAFLLENAAFLLIGLQLPVLLRAVGESGRSAASVAGFCLLVLAVTVVVRVLFLFAAAGASRVLPGLAADDTRWTFRGSLLVGWAGMRGVVTLAAAFAVPATAPELPLLQLAAFTVVAGTLLIQGLTLPLLVRRLGLRGPDPAEDALAEAVLLEGAARAGLERLEALVAAGDAAAPSVVDQLRGRARARVDAAWERLGPAEEERATPSAQYRRLRLAMLAAEREAILDAQRSGGYDDLVLRSALAQLDLEESLLDEARGSTEAGAATGRTAEPLVGAAVPTPGCEDLERAPRTRQFEDTSVCGACVREGTTWVHLRGCLECGVVSCCDSSPRRHATAHWHESKHPVMRSVEAGEAWRWCYAHELAD
ncbi:monovalent cation:H+ antiporter, CPA1 family [Quadrisphaera granulorum]|uniref:CPA1 family monovalent cation:H+ antiporter n=1 Tax=Quadrisphaera granulorum TaxID=317664 RepID=A0A316A4T1_9ACTN|nr:cation:proton antiporter [Quadrisphaera granulorum]PWJ51814.1 CPA1 family monovalent cation:H+ antiporter [Quadrisphaera granulorum]SZE97761.1 monovalent cation:H+ antiporter, CPA1 family [Quadrisphaera granulorum]